MKDYQKYVNGIKNELLAYEQQEDYYLEAMRNSLAISNVYDELWERAVVVKDPAKREELMLIVNNVKRAKQVYDLMLNRYQHANITCARQISYNKALIEYVENIEAEEELANRQLTIEDYGAHEESFFDETDEI